MKSQDSTGNTALRTKRANPWIVGRFPAAGSGLRLLCFPQAGGAAGAFSSWRGRLPAGVELLPVELPGRGTRAAEPPPGTLQELAAAALDALRGELRAPYALFGHSFGALVAHELARRIHRAALPAPRALLLSAARPPHLPAPDTRRGRVHRAGDAELLAWLRETGGIPDALTRHPDHLRAVLAAVRCDIRLTDSYRLERPEPLPCPLHVFGGLSDPVVPPRDLEEWDAYEGPDFSLTLHPGDHFYLYAAPDALLRDIARLTRTAARPEGSNTP
ncbi:alpha/beta fold hydrolase [Streptomyces sp. SL13]|uniref:Alpha/beta fold hydrolase n=1 Tax=Streptantibioticus silvisoli TaxID=2705255 RepID=A0AA90HCT0_9ACTN|nr:alpha/beta fold hydrolase [Streptantibioticus silvisoli]MDI5966360.1 alpha/beta fold hydrolase [Streptantibioticus silvisoli]MDI5974269.1 alpha/beta fold hydrolase [Streptantibioticus silvisoli]